MWLEPIIMQFKKVATLTLLKIPKKVQSVTILFKKATDMKSNLLIQL